jgi:cellobiose phosphorylase
MTTSAIDALPSNKYGYFAADGRESVITDPRPPRPWANILSITARVRGRCGYCQQSGAFGFRDQLQDSQVFLTIEPERCRDQIRLHAAHQFADGSVYHWWHPLFEQGHVTKMTDDLLWLGFVVANYLKETGRFEILADEELYLDDPRPHLRRDHVERAFARVFRRTSPRGAALHRGRGLERRPVRRGPARKGRVGLGGALPGRAARRLGGDLPAHRRCPARCGFRPAAAGTGRGHQPVRVGRRVVLARHARRRERLRIARQRARADLHLNAQTWAVPNDVAPPDRAAACMAAVLEHLVSPAGALLLAPAYDTPVPEIGYITRYAPGLRENSGAYTHAATWAIAAAAKAKDAELVGRMLLAIDTARKGPESYWAEPIVLPGNVDGPESPHRGRAGWTWHTGSAAWLHRVVTQWVLGFRPEWSGLRADPCLPPEWRAARMVRPWRGSTYRFSITRGSSPSVTVDGRRLEEHVLAPPGSPGEEHTVEVTIPSDGR